MAYLQIIKISHQKKITTDYNSTRLDLIVIAIVLLQILLLQKLQPNMKF